MIVHLVYGKAVDLRLCLLLSKLEFGVQPVSDWKKLLDADGPSGASLVVVDLEAEPDYGVDIIAALASRLEMARIVAVCTNGCLDLLRRCFMAGAIDVIDKSFDDERIGEAFGAVRSAETEAVSSPAPLGRRRARFGALTAREREVLRCLADGLTSREIGSLLSLSPRTVDVHRARLQDKLGARNVAQMAYEYSPFIGALASLRPVGGGGHLLR